MSDFMTCVYELPADKGARVQFVEGLEKLAEECGALKVSGSKHDEMTYLELLESELSEQIGETAVEDLRQRYERGEVSVET